MAAQNCAVTVSYRSPAMHAAIYNGQITCPRARDYVCRAQRIAHSVTPRSNLLQKGGLGDTVISDNIIVQRGRNGLDRRLPSGSAGANFLRVTFEPVTSSSFLVPSIFSFTSARYFTTLVSSYS